MKRYWIIALVLLVAMPGCRKGEEDPLISLRTRKGRLTGEWKVESYERFKDYGDIRWIRYSPDSGLTYMRDDSTFFTRPFSWDMSFNSNGDYASTQVEDMPADEENNNPYTLTTTERGEWKFTGGNGVPSKSQLVFLASEFESQRSDQGSNINVITISGPVDAEIYTIQRLASNNLWLNYAKRTNFPFFSETDSVSIRFVQE